MLKHAQNPVFDLTKLANGGKFNVVFPTSRLVGYATILITASETR